MTRHKQKHPRRWDAWFWLTGQQRDDGLHAGQQGDEEGNNDPEQLQPQRRSKRKASAQAENWATTCNTPAVDLVGLCELLFFSAHLPAACDDMHDGCQVTLQAVQQGCATQPLPEASPLQQQQQKQQQQGSSPPRQPHASSAEQAAAAAQGSSGDTASAPLNSTEAFDLTGPSSQGGATELQASAGLPPRSGLLHEAPAAQGGRDAAASQATATQALRLTCLPKGAQQPVQVREAGCTNKAAVRITQ